MTFCIHLYCVQGYAASMEVTDSLFFCCPRRNSHALRNFPNDKYVAKLLACLYVGEAYPESASKGFQWNQILRGQKWREGIYFLLKKKRKQTFWWESSSTNRGREMAAYPLSIANTSFLVIELISLSFFRSKVQHFLGKLLLFLFHKDLCCLGWCKVAGSLKATSSLKKLCAFFQLFGIACSQSN